MTNTKDYTGKIVSMGIDVHKKIYCCVSICEGEVVKRDTMPANAEFRSDLVSCGDSAASQ
jgi:hypothetical protein